MDKLLEIGEIGLLRDIPSDLTFLTNENKLLKHTNNKLKIEKRFLLCGIVILVLYFIWSEIKKSKEKLNS
jgi:hypothetical protein